MYEKGVISNNSKGKEITGLRTLMSMFKSKLEMKHITVIDEGKYLILYHDKDENMWKNTVYCTTSRIMAFNLFKDLRKSYPLVSFRIVYLKEGRDVERLKKVA